MFCNICLEAFRNPFVTPCGHIFCFDCLTSSAQKSPDAMKAPCPTCRATFSLVTPDRAFVPEKYRPFIDSNIRRIYLDVSSEIALQEKLAILESRVKRLEKDKSSLMTKCESHMATATAYAQKEKDARMQVAILRKELLQFSLGIRQPVEKMAPKKSVSTSSRPSLHVDPPPADPPSSSSGRGTLEKRGLLTSNFGPQWGELHGRPIIPLPKRRRVSQG